MPVLKSYLIKFFDASFHDEFIWTFFLEFDDDDFENNVNPLNGLVDNSKDYQQYGGQISDSPSDYGYDYNVKNLEDDTYDDFDIGDMNDYADLITDDDEMIKNSKVVMGSGSKSQVQVGYQKCRVFFRFWGVWATRIHHY